MNKFTIGDRLRYAFDNTMSKGAIALIGWLALVAAIIIGVISLIVYFTGVLPEADLLQILWMSLMRSIDSGTVAGDAGGWPLLAPMLAVTIGGIFVMSTLIGVLTSGIEAKLEQLRKGRSKVIAKDHTVILGWSPHVFPIIVELVEANASRGKACIAILGEKDKVEMEDEIRDKVGPTRGTRVVCRTGSSIDINDLEIVGIHNSRSIIILAPESDDPDADVIKTMLAITNHPSRRKEPYHIVTELHNSRNLEVAKLVGKEEAELVPIGDLISRITAQTCRQSGLSIVYTELMDFGGDEIYFYEEPALVGKTFGDSLTAYEDCSVIGLRLKNGGPRLNPPMDTKIEKGDKLIVIAEDDDKIKLSGLTNLGIAPTAIAMGEVAAPAPERTLILGWNWRASKIIGELDAYVAPGSVVTILAQSEGGQVDIDLLRPSLKRQTVDYRLGDPTDRVMLNSLAIETYLHVILLSSDESNPQKSDARTLMTLLHLRDIREKTGGAFSIVSEMLDVRNRTLAEVTRADDFIVSDKLISLMLSQISENKELNAVFADLFDPEGSEIYLKPAENYLALGQPVNFYTVVEAARQRNEAAIGYRRKAQAKNAAKAYGVVVNPDKSVKIAFAAGDKIIVLAEE